MEVPLDEPMASGPPAEPETAHGSEFDRPWNPWWLVLFALIFGLPGGGGLLALNYGYLGIPGRRGRAFLGVLAASILIPSAIQWAIMSAAVDHRDEAAMRALFLAGRIASALVAISMAWAQHARWVEFRATGEPRGKLLIPGILAAIVSLVLVALLGNLAALLFAMLYGVLTFSWSP